MRKEARILEDALEEGKDAGKAALAVAKKSLADAEAAANLFETNDDLKKNASAKEVKDAKGMLWLHVLQIYHDGSTASQTVYADPGFVLVARASDEYLARSRAQLDQPFPPPRHRLLVLVLFARRHDSILPLREQHGLDPVYDAKHVAVALP